MFNFKTVACILGVSFAILYAYTPDLEAGHYHHHRGPRTRVNIQVGPAIPPPSYIVSSPVYQPVCWGPQPVIAYPVYQPVYIAPPQPIFTGLSFSWFFR